MDTSTVSDSEFTIDEDILMLISIFGQPWQVTMRWIISRGNLANERNHNCWMLFVAAPIEAITTDKPTYGPSEHIQCLAMNMYHEARDQGTAGKLAVSVSCFK